MPQEILLYIAEYGYWSVFLLVFLQEVGVPNPLPNEILLLMAGAIAYAGMLNFGYLLLLSFWADILSSTILFCLFHKFGQRIFDKLPPWVPISRKRIDQLSSSINKEGMGAIFIGRITPFVRGYVSVISGLLRINSRNYFMVQYATALIWSLGYLSAGYILAYFGYSVQSHLKTIASLFWQIPLGGVLIFGLYRLIRIIPTDNNTQSSK